MSRPPQPKRTARGGAGRNDARPARGQPDVSLRFLGTTATLRLHPPTPVAAVRLDGAPLPADSWTLSEHPAEDGTEGGAQGGAQAGALLRIDCPAIAFDATAHVLRLDWAEAGLPPRELPFRSQYDAGIATADDRRLSGWITDALRPDSPLTLHVACGGHRLQVRNTAAPDPDDADAPPGRFEIALPPSADATVPELLTITVAGTTCQPFGQVLRGATLPAAIAAGARAARSIAASPGGRLFGTLLLPMLAHSLATAALPGAVVLRGRQDQPRAAVPEIDVIVPVYRGEAETLACLASLFDGGNRIRHRIVVIDDCSPEPSLSAALRELDRAGRIHLLRNESNLGFVASVNRGMALSATADVLLLNSDTLVPPGLLDRLYRAAASDPMIATVTPLSNNATAFSLPAPPGDPADPWGMPHDAVDAICQTVNAGALRDIPTAHGFCMFIRRAALDDVGPFDAAAFGTGYGEENDFSLRALLRGWRNVCAADIYVAHVGTVSFGATAARDTQLAANLATLDGRYPFYHAQVAAFLRSDPLHDLRNNVQKAVWRQHPRIAVFVTLALDGGASRHARDIMLRLAGEGWLVLALTSAADAGGEPRLRLQRAGSEEALRYPPAAAQEEVLGDILDLAPRFIHVQHMIDLPDGIAAFVRGCGIPYAVTLHDFFYACPKVTLLDAGARYCGMPPAAKCTRCVRQGPVHPQLHPTLHPHAATGESWRGLWDGFLREAAQVIAPSRDTADRYAYLFPGLPVTVRPHFAPSDLAPPPAPLSRPSGSRLRVALPGAIGPQKGARDLIELARHCSRWHDDISFVVVGYTDREEEFRRHDNVTVLGGYDPAAALTALAAAACDVALLLNVFPETFSYTLSECLQVGLAPVAYDFGAIGERMRALGAGVAVPPGAPPEQIVAALRAAARRPVRLPAEALYGRYDGLMAAYYAPALADLAEVAPAPDTPRLLGPVEGLSEDGWCDGVLRFRLWSARPPQRLALTFWVPEEAAFQAVAIACDDIPLGRHAIEDGARRRFVLPVPPGEAGRRAEITCRFDFVFRLQPPDIRFRAAMLAAIEVSEGAGWLALDLPGVAPPAQMRATVAA